MENLIVLLSHHHNLSLVKLLLSQTGHLEKVRRRFYFSFTIVTFVSFDTSIFRLAFPLIVLNPHVLYMLFAHACMSFYACLLCIFLCEIVVFLAVTGS